MAWWPQWDSLEGQRGGQEREGRAGEEAGASASGPGGGAPGAEADGGAERRPGGRGGGCAGAGEERGLFERPSLGPVCPGEVAFEGQAGGLAAFLKPSHHLDVPMKTGCRVSLTHNGLPGRPESSEQDSDPSDEENQRETAVRLWGTQPGTTEGSGAPHKARRSGRVPSITLAGRPEPVSVSGRLCSPAGPQPRPLGPCLSACMLGVRGLLGHSVDVQSPGRPGKKTTSLSRGPSACVR